MKHFKKIALLLLSAMCLTVLSSANTLKVSAEQPTTHLIVLDGDTWTCRVGGGTWDDSEPAEHWEIYYLENGTFKDGDTLVIDGDASEEQRLELDLGQRRIGNLTITNRSDNIVVNAGSIDECHILSDSSASITGPITNAYVYDYAVVTFCSDVANLNLVGSDISVHATVGCLGTVGHLIARDDAYIRYECYNVAKGQLDIYEGDLKTDSAYYTVLPSAATPTAPVAYVPQSTPQAAPPAASAPAASGASDAYDKVPKTGDSSVPLPLLLVGVAAVCFAGRTALKRA
ncbi:MAG: hypothetical protein NC094_03750 [Bacteroidales bacterium]|nr:hypothetical protein [Lachnoclostridium sp.]MCM1383835.1 hypothetical protein [Lachnoclostridium sp.]MCM1464512.1 hypothetical protein [Bacteroidales bacterium]